jgi:hypothetical protein
MPCNLRLPQGSLQRDRSLASATKSPAAGKRRFPAWLSKAVCLFKTLLLAFRSRPFPKINDKNIAHKHACFL